MEKVYHAESHSMGWCLDCHRAPEKHLRPLEEVYNLSYEPKVYLEENEVIDTAGLIVAKGERITDPDDFGKLLKAHWGVQPKESCATCHR